MPKFAVSYETDKKPSAWDLPIGAKITEVSALPFKATFGKYRNVEIKVEESALANKAAFIYVKDNDATGYKAISEWMSPEQTRDLYLALKEIVGE